MITVVHQLRKLYWKLTKPKTSGVRCLIFNESGQVLLVKHFYSREWYLPGGAMKSNETPEIAIIRELKEECGIENLMDLKLLQIYENLFEYKRDTIYLFSANCVPALVQFNLEIEKFSFFDTQILPERTSLGTRKRILEFQLKQFNSQVW